MKIIIVKLCEINREKTRVFATILILFCHLVPCFDNTILKMSAQFFSVGVSVFLILSGYLYGKRKIKPLNWIIYIFNLQALEIYINGAEHLWYLTIVMICYFITIPLDIIMLVYFVGMYWNSNNINTKYIIVFSLITIIAVITRVIGRTIFDDTVLYNVLITEYTQTIIGFSILFIVFYLVSKFENKLTLKVIKYFNSISYEVYLSYYMFIVGPVGLMNITSSKIINSLIVIGCTYLSVVLLHKVSQMICKPKFSKMVSYEKRVSSII